MGSSKQWLSNVGLFDQPAKKPCSDCKNPNQDAYCPGFDACFVCFVQINRGNQTTAMLPSGSFHPPFHGIDLIF
jgi:hypothetical protein